MRLISVLLLCAASIACGGSTPSGRAGAGTPDVPAIQDATKKVWTCEDKTRVLLHSEDGKLHCFKF